ncbi:MAG: hypothetical protein KBH81_08980 [Phycisphaerae bacterium]|jgi:hypothetical protein|nr:hypothetical protein [Phycisphaerae bacterium]HOO15985.1 PKD domain-containing protein [Phycisphaerae bacterium]
MTSRTSPRILSLAALVSVTCLLVGCPPNPTPPVPRPVANAGPDQTVSVGDEVTLDGSASAPSRAGTLTFTWQQLAGTPVVLDNPHEPIATFLAPDSPTILTFQLIVTESTGRSAEDTTQVTVEGAPPPIPEAILYVANAAGGSVTAYGFDVPFQLDGDLPPAAELIGPINTAVNIPTAVVIENTGTLLVYNAGTPSITGYPDALTLVTIDGDRPPTRVIQGAATNLVGPAAMAYDAANDVLFVADADTDVINVFANASLPFSGNVAPTRVIDSPDVAFPRGLSLGSNGELYVANGLDVDSVAVFDNAATLDGAVFAARLIRSPAFEDLFDAFIDVNNTLYVVNGAGGGNQISIFANALTLDGEFLPDAIVTVIGAVNLSAIIVDADGNAYIADPDNNAIYGYNKLVMRDGLALPDRTLRGPATGLAGPLRMFLVDWTTCATNQLPALSTP